MDGTFRFKAWQNSLTEIKEEKAWMPSEQLSSIWKNSVILNESMSSVKTEHSLVGTIKSISHL